jgi:hypothetical protein
MTAGAVSYSGVFGPARGRRRLQRLEDAPAALPSPVELAPTHHPRASRIARNLALAYLIERRIEDETLKEYADAARRLGLTRARVAQVMELLSLPAQEQERILSRDSCSQ